MSFKIFVDGQEGTTGLRINDYLARRSDIELLKIDSDKRKDATARAQLINASDVTFLCLPDAAARLMTMDECCDMLALPGSYFYLSGWLIHYNGSASRQTTVYDLEIPSV